MKAGGLFCRVPKMKASSTLSTFQLINYCLSLTCQDRINQLLMQAQMANLTGQAVSTFYC
jgi:hypothetical protein